MDLRSTVFRWIHNGVKPMEISSRQKTWKFQGNCTEWTWSYHWFYMVFYEMSMACKPHKFQLNIRKFHENSTTVKVLCALQCSCHTRYFLYNTKRNRYALCMWMSLINALKWQRCTVLTFNNKLDINSTFLISPVYNSFQYDSAVKDRQTEKRLVKHHLLGGDNNTVLKLSLIHIWRCRRRG